MVNPFKDVQWNPDVAERRKFAKSLVIGFPAIALIFLVIGWIARGQWDANLKLALWLAIAGAGAGVLFWLVPQIAKPFYMVWYFLACCIGIVVGNVLLSAFYYLIFTPAGLLRRSLSKGGLKKGFQKNAATYWKDVPPEKDPARYYQQF